MLIFGAIPHFVGNPNVVLLPKWHTDWTLGEAGKCKEIDISELEIRD
jgi:hypothetical protein